MIGTIISIELVSVFLLLTRWSRQYFNGAYKLRGSPDPDDAFLGHLLMGLFPVVGMAFLLGEHLHRRDVARQAGEKELEDAQRDIMKLLDDDE